jgi:hypothetical protein
MISPPNIFHASFVTSVLLMLPLNILVPIHPFAISFASHTYIHPPTTRLLHLGLVLDSGLDISPTYPQRRSVGTLAKFPSSGVRLYLCIQMEGEKSLNIKSLLYTCILPNPSLLNIKVCVSNFDLSVRVLL